MVTTKNKGFISIAVIFILGMVALLIGMSLVKTSFGEAIMSKETAGSAKAFYIANSGVEEAIYQIGLNPTLGNPGPTTLPELSIGGGTAQVTVTGTESQRTIESVGSYPNYIRRIEAKVQSTTLKPGFMHAVQAGEGGFQLSNNTLITNINPGEFGNVYSNSFIKGKSNKTSGSSCHSESSQINGSAWAVTNIQKINSSDDGVCVVKDVYAQNLNECYAVGKRYSPNSPSVKCPGGIYTNQPAPTPIPLPDMGLNTIYGILLHRQYWGSDCIADGSGSASDCTLGTGELGDIMIDGNLIKPSGKNLVISGPVWVTQNIVLNSNGSIKPKLNPQNLSYIIVAQGTIASNSNLTFGKTGQEFLMFVSKQDPGTAPGSVCADAATPAITISSNSQSVLFYAISGCVKILANSTFYGAILGQGIRVENNSTVEYDPELQTAIFGQSAEGGWQTISFKEK